LRTLHLTAFFQGLELFTHISIYSKFQISVQLNFCIVILSEEDGGKALLQKQDKTGKSYHYLAK